VALLIALFLTLAAPFVLLNPAIVKPTVEMLTPAVLLPSPSPPAPRRPVEHTLLERQIQGLHELTAEAENGTLLSPTEGQVVAVVSQELVQRLVSALVPSEHLIAGRYQVVVRGASATFEDGFALVRLEGRASFAGAAAESVWAELVVLGALEIPREQPSPDVLRAKVSVVAVDARRVDVLMESRQAKALVEALGKEKLESFAALAPNLEIPVRHDYEVSIPSVGPRGPLEIAPAVLPVRLAVKRVKAFAGRLWISMAAAVGTAPTSPAPAPTPAVPVPLPFPAPSAASDLAVLRQEHERLHLKLQERLQHDALVSTVQKTPRDVTLAVDAALADRILDEVARRYFDRVALELREFTVRKQGELEKETLFGHTHVGDWAVTARLRGVEGVLRAGHPHARYGPRGRVTLDLPVFIDRGRGQALLDFRWNSRGLANLFCKDFEIHRTLSGRVVPEEYRVRGLFETESEANTLVARPRFDRTYRIRVDPTDTSWMAVREELEKQDTLGRCGIGLDPAKVENDLRALAARGFQVVLPSRIFRTVQIPFAVSESVQVGHQRVDIALAGVDLNFGPKRLWFSGAVRVGSEAVVKSALLRSER
jgi:hypothetical protein